MAGTDTGRYASCKTGADTVDNPDCVRVAVENSLYNYWSEALPEQSDVRFQPEAMQTFTGGTSTGCGNATAEVGPFYCPADATIYLDTTFFEQVLQQQLDGPSGAFVEPYVLAHEFGHHIQNLLGTMGQVRTQQGPNSDAVRLELQADCYAGMWAKNATSTDDRRRRAAAARPHRRGRPAGDRGGQGRGRRPDPAADHGPGQQGAVDPRLRRGPGEVVPDRLQRGHPPGLRHVRPYDR